jgi:putative transcriptional regulator
MTKKTGKTERGILGTVRKTAAGLRRADVIDKATMRKFDALCLSAVTAMAPEEIKNTYARDRRTRT